MAALTLAAWHALPASDDPVMLVTPADQVIPGSANIHEALQRADEAAQQDAIVTLK